MAEVDVENPLTAMQELVELYKDRISDLEKRIEDLNKIIVEFVDLQPIPDLTRIEPV